MQDFRQLKVWEKSHSLALSVFRITSEFPKSEQYGLINQMRRAACSIASNIAEGTGRNSDVDFARFLQMAMGSACELEYQLLLSKDLGWLQPFRALPEDQYNFETLQESIIEIKRMLTSLIQKLRT